MTYFNLKAKAFIILLTAALFGSGAYAQAQTGGVVGAQTYAENFFKAYKEDTRKAVFELFKTNPRIDSGKLEDIVKTIDKERKNIGDYHGKELITQKKASGSLVLYSYLVKHDVQPVRFTFMFYKPKNDWIIYRFYFDGNVDSELQDSAKL
ncbi:hypothetical protein EOD41_08360 [Mucilaginibacter limnophilus]|uniref:DUF3887 domain-containing protein n=1 Tax=Mucilaginibacter limnophilus TaxID=1932778 RepID=A0A3S2WZP2_9SPHI|nr:hypothetical protein [Mucilaginibacter limnophilus]RVU01955.1 hypothetical protein EOD41_08360 [Mucilaginibacter limnophilus]